ncbi:Nif3-like dinuclear metal center hexameric protein [Verrucomicrobiaceae bacterium 227]
MAKLDQIVSFLDSELKTSEIPDYSGAHNGLQLQNGGRVTKVASAVDASLPVFEKVIASGADLLIVHHGMFWQNGRTVTGPTYRKLKMAMDAGLAVYSSHIPLDIHPTLGNNVLLMEGLKLGKGSPFFNWKGIELGRQVDFAGQLGELVARLESLLKGKVHVRGDLGKPAGRVGVITGGAGSEVEAMAAEGIETFITGEGPHWSYPLAEELEINLLFGGHYATETLGVQAVGRLISGEFGVSHEFIDHPTGL